MIFPSGLFLFFPFIHYLCHTFLLLSSCHSVYASFFFLHDLLFPYLITILLFSFPLLSIIFSSILCFLHWLSFPTIQISFSSTILFSSFPSLTYSDSSFPLFFLLIPPDYVCTFSYLLSPSLSSDFFSVQGGYKLYEKWGELKQSYHWI